MDSYLNHKVDMMLSKDTSHIPEPKTALELFFGREESYNIGQVRTMYEQAAKIWFEQGYQFTGENMTGINLVGSIENTRHKAFYDEFLQLCARYGVRITYHPAHGMIFEDLIKP